MTRELDPEWDDATRAQVEGLALHESECCPGCGLHKSVLDDFGNHHYQFEHRYCPACADIKRHARVVAEQDDDETPRDKDGRPAWEARDRRPDDGRHITLRRMTPTEVAERVGTKRVDSGKKKPPRLR